jgi:hypothetical protein
MTGAEPRIPRTFAGAEIGDRQNRVCPGGFVRLVSNADFPISGIARRERGETGLLFLETVCIRVAERRCDKDALAVIVSLLGSGWMEPNQTRSSCSSCSVQDSGRLRASRVTVRSAGAQPSAIASMTRGDR